MENKNEKCILNDDSEFGRVISRNVNQFKNDSNEDDRLNIQIKLSQLGRSVSLGRGSLKCQNKEQNRIYDDLKIKMQKFRSLEKTDASPKKS